jgi:hypothetical protein
MSEFEGQYTPPEAMEEKAKESPEAAEASAEQSEFVAARLAFIELAQSGEYATEAYMEAKGRFHDALHELADQTQPDGIRDLWVQQERVKTFVEAGLVLEVTQAIEDGLDVARQENNEEYRMIFKSLELAPQLKHEESSPQ